MKAPNNTPHADARGALCLAGVSGRAPVDVDVKVQK